MRRKLNLTPASPAQAKVKDRKASIAALCDTLIDAVCERGEWRLVRDLAAPPAMAVIGDMLGVRPERRDMFLRWSDDPNFLSSHVSEDFGSPWTPSRPATSPGPHCGTASGPHRRPGQRAGEFRGLTAAASDDGLYGTLLI